MWERERQINRGTVVLDAYASPLQALTFRLCGFVSIGGWLFAYFLVPETKGRTLEEIEAHWRDGKHSGESLKHDQPTLAQ